MTDERTVYITNFDEKVTESLLEEIFTQMGPVDYAKIVDNTAHPYAFVQFVDEESVLYSITMMDGLKLYGQPISVKPRKNSNQEQIYHSQQRSRQNSDSRRQGKHHAITSNFQVPLVAQKTIMNELPPVVNVQSNRASHQQQPQQQQLQHPHQQNVRVPYDRSREAPQPLNPFGRNDGRGNQRYDGPPQQLAGYNARNEGRAATQYYGGAAQDGRANQHYGHAPQDVRGNQNYGGAAQDGRANQYGHAPPDGRGNQHYGHAPQGVRGNQNYGGAAQDVRANQHYGHAPQDVRGNQHYGHAPQPLNPFAGYDPQNNGRPTQYRGEFPHGYDGYYSIPKAAAETQRYIDNNKNHRQRNGKKWH